jgi:UDP-glucose 4-epimerase
MNLQGYNLYNVGFGGSHPLEEVTHIVAQLLDKKITVNFNNQIRPGDVTKMISDKSKVPNAFQWKPIVGIQRVGDNSTEGYMLLNFSVHMNLY